MDMKTSKQTYIKINHTQHTDITREATQDEWDADDLMHSHSFDGYSIGDKDWWDFIINDYDPNKTYYMVYVLYGTGDTFHHEDNCICMVELFDNAEDANALCHAIEKNDAKNDRVTCDYSYNIKVKLPSGRKYETSASSWTGYFECFESANVEAVVLNEHYKY